MIGFNVVRFPVTARTKLVGVQGGHSRLPALAFLLRMIQGSLIFPARFLDLCLTFAVAPHSA